MFFSVALPSTAAASVAAKMGAYEEKSQLEDLTPAVWKAAVKCDATRSSKQSKKPIIMRQIKLSGFSRGKRLISTDVVNLPLCASVTLAIITAGVF